MPPKQTRRGKYTRLPTTTPSVKYAEGPLGEIQKRLSGNVDKLEQRSLLMQAIQTVYNFEARSEQIDFVSCMTSFCWKMLVEIFSKSIALCRLLGSFVVSLHCTVKINFNSEYISRLVVLQNDALFQKRYYYFIISITCLTRSKNCPRGMVFPFLKGMIKKEEVEKAST